MKKAVLITGIVWSVLCFLAALICLIVGFAIVGSADEVAKAAVEAAQDPEMTYEVAYAAAIILGVAPIIIGAYLLVGGVFSVVLVATRNSAMKKGAGIALGIVAFVFGAELPAVFYVIDSAKSR